MATNSHEVTLTWRDHAKFVGSLAYSAVLNSILPALGALTISPAVVELLFGGLPPRLLAMFEAQFAAVGGVATFLMILYLQEALRGPGWL